jgi:hypothetical protein
MHLSNLAHAMLERSQRIGIRSHVPSPAVEDPLIKVLVLREIYVGGVAREIGTKVTMQSSDAWALSASVPPAVAFLK